MSEAPSAPALALSDDTLGSLPEAVSVPGYDRSALVPAVVHIGVGGFHRAHQAVYLDELARQGVTDWGLVGVGMHSPQVGEVLAAQDRLYLVVERGADSDSARVVGAMTRYLLAAEEPDAVLDVLADERTRLVTLTITGTSYLIDAHTGEFDASDARVTADLEDPGHPDTVFGYLVEALGRRRAAGLPPFTVLSCDNMQHNGHAARTAVVSFARLRDERDGGDLADWIDANVAFPSSMVDRITPNTTPEDRDAIAAEVGVDDRWPIITEPFTQWVVEDDFCNGRPPLDQVGVQFVPDVTPYETMKTRLLNGCHTAVGYLGYLAGYRTTDAVMADPVFREYLARMMAEEIAPNLPEVPGIDLDEYQATILERLANPKMGDQLVRLGRRGSTKIPHYILPSIAAAVEHDTPSRLLCLAVAGWMRYLRGYDYAGEEVPVVGPLTDRLVPLAQEGGEEPDLLLSERAVFGDLSQDVHFAAAVEVALRALEQQGPREVIAFHLARADRAVA
jgi:mannitol 2-dehydrogenase